MPNETINAEPVERQLDISDPGWRARVNDATEAAALSIRRMADAGELGHLETLKFHIKNEMGVLRLVLQSPDLPERVRVELQASLTRMARMV